VQVGDGHSGKDGPGEGVKKKPRKTGNPGLKKDVPKTGSSPKRVKGHCERPTLELVTGREGPEAFVNGTAAR